MIVFDHVTHSARPSMPPVLDDASFALPADRKVAVFALRGAGRTTLARLVSGQLAKPKRGVISRGGLRVSYPIGPQIQMSPQNTLQQNLQDVARIFGFPFPALRDFVVEHGDAEPLLHRRVHKFSPGERSRAFCPIGFCLPFDYYVADGDPLGAAKTHRERFKRLFIERTRDAGLLYIANDPTQARMFCDMGAVLHGGKLSLYEEFDEALEIYLQELKPIEDRLTAAVHEEDALRAAEAGAPLETLNPLSPAPERRKKGPRRVKPAEQRPAAAPAAAPEPTPIPPGGVIL